MSTTEHEGLTFEDPIIETQEQKPEEVKEPEPVNEDKVARQPVRYEGETDTQYSLRLQLFNAGLAKSQAETEEEKSLINDHIKEIRSKLHSKPTHTETTKQEVTEELFQSEEEKRNAVENLRKLGFVSQEEVEKRIQDAVENIKKEQNLSRYESNIRQQQEAIKGFYASRPDIASNPEIKRVIENTVITKFKITLS